MLMFVAIVWQHTAALAATSAVQWTHNGRIEGQLGTITTALGWTAVALLAVATIGIRISMLSLLLLDQLTEEEPASYQLDDIYIVSNVERL